MALNLPIQLEKPKRDENGFLVANAIIAHEGVFNYPHGGRMVAAYMPPRELVKNDFIESLEAIPFVVGHSDISPANVQREMKGALFGIRAEKNNSMLVGSIRIYDQEIIDEIENSTDMPAVSVAYGCRFIKQNGIFGGERFEYIQTDMKANHLALVDQPNMEMARMQNEEFIKIENRLVKIENLFKEGTMNNDFDYSKLSLTIKKLVNEEIEEKKDKDDMKEMSEKMNAMEKKLANIEEALKKSSGEKENKDKGDSIENVLNAREQAEFILGSKLNTGLNNLKDIHNHVLGKVRNARGGEIVRCNNDVESAIAFSMIYNEKSGEAKTDPSRFGIEKVTNESKEFDPENIVINIGGES